MPQNPSVEDPDLIAKRAAVRALAQAEMDRSEAERRLIAARQHLTRCREAEVKCRNRQDSLFREVYLGEEIHPLLAAAERNHVETAARSAADSPASDEPLTEFADRMAPLYVGRKTAAERARSATVEPPEETEPVGPRPSKPKNDVPKPAPDKPPKPAKPLREVVISNVPVASTTAARPEVIPPDFDYCSLHEPAKPHPGRPPADSPRAIDSIFTDKARTGTFTGSLAPGGKPATPVIPLADLQVAEPLLSKLARAGIRDTRSFEELVHGNLPMLAAICGTDTIGVLGIVAGIRALVEGYGAPPAVAKRQTKADREQRNSDLAKRKLDRREEGKHELGQRLDADARRSARAAGIPPEAELDEAETSKAARSATGKRRQPAGRAVT